MDYFDVATGEASWLGRANVNAVHLPPDGRRTPRGSTELSMHGQRRTTARDGLARPGGRAGCPPDGGRVRSPSPSPVSRGAQPNRPGAPTGQPTPTPGYAGRVTFSALSSSLPLAGRKPRCARRGLFGVDRPPSTD